MNMNHADVHASLLQKLSMAYPHCSSSIPPFAGAFEYSSNAEGEHFKIPPLSMFFHVEYYKLVSIKIVLIFSLNLLKIKCFISPYEFGFLATKREAKQ